MKPVYPVIDDHKECGKCHIVKPVSEFSMKKYPSGVIAPGTHCKECKTNYARKLRRSQGIPHTKRYPIINDHKRCTVCNEHKHVSEYGIKKSTGKMLAKCIPCMHKYLYEKGISDQRLDYVKDYQEKNKDRLKTRSTNYSKRCIEDLSDWYVKGILGKYGDIDRRDIPQELIKMKRKQLLLSRQIKQLKQL